MSAMRVILKIFAAAAALFFLVACDDDDSKKEKPEYEVEIYYSEDVKIRWFKQPAEQRGFKKPRVHVDHPEGVKTTHEERPPRKKTVFDFAPIALPAMLSLFLAMASRRKRLTPSVSVFLASRFHSPTYQRG